MRVASAGGLSRVLLFVLRGLCRVSGGEVGLSLVLRGLSIVPRATGRVASAAGSV